MKHSQCFVKTAWFHICALEGSVCLLEVADDGKGEMEVQSLLKVAIHGGGGATRPDLGRAVQFEGHWIARPNPGTQRAGGAAGAGAE